MIMSDGKSGNGADSLANIDWRTPELRDIPIQPPLRPKRIPPLVLFPEYREVPVLCTISLLLTVFEPQVGHVISIFYSH